MTDRHRIKQYFFHIALIGTFSILAMASIFYYGVTSGNDLFQHYQFANTIHQAVVTGEFYPSWAASPNQGYGDAAIRFYPPFSYYVLSVSYILTGDWYGASLLTFFLIFWTGGVGIYFWAREEFSATQALLAAGLYTFAPYHVNQIYNNFLYAEFAASAVIPFCFLFITRVCRKRQFGDVCGLSVSFALLLLTHLPLSIIGSLIFFVYAISLLKKDSFLTVLAKLSAAIGVAVAASSFYWIRLITELDWIKHSSENYFIRTFDYRENFLFAPQNIINFQTDTSVLWFADLMLLAMLLISIPSAILFVKNRRSLPRFSVSLALIFAISVLMTTPVSKFIWDHLFFLQKVQFPWRWLGIVSMSGAVFSAAGVFSAAEAMNKNKNNLLAVGLGIILTFYAFMSAFVIKQAVYLPREKFEQQIAGIESGNSFDCWWLVWAKNEALEIKEKAVAGGGGGRNVEIQTWEPLEKTLKISGGEPTLLRVAVFYYPYWRAKVNEEPVPVQKNDDGSISVAVAGGEATVKLYFEEPGFVKIASLISALTWLFLLAGISTVVLKPFKAKYFAKSL